MMRLQKTSPVYVDNYNVVIDCISSCVSVFTSGDGHVMQFDKKRKKKELLEGFFSLGHAHLGYLLDM